MKRSVAMAALLTLFTVTGCTTTTQMGSPIQQASIDTIEKGVTGENELSIMFGQPYSTSTDQDGNRTLMYIFSRTTINALSGQYENNAKTLMVTLDKNGKVSGYTQQEINNPHLNTRTY